MDELKLRTQLFFSVKVTRLIPELQNPVLKLWRSYIGDLQGVEIRVDNPLQVVLEEAAKFTDPAFELDFSDKYRFEICTHTGESFASVTINSRDIARTHTLTLDLKKETESIGTLEVSTTTGVNSETLYLKLRGIRLKDMDSFSKSDPFFRVTVPFAGNLIPLYQSEVITDTLDPVWRGVFLDKATLLRDSRESQIRIEVYDEDPGVSDYIGGCITSLSQLTSSDCILELRASPESDGPITGRLRVDKAHVSPTKGMIDYMRSGVEFALTVAIDFSEKNRPTSHPKSLHRSGAENAYESALRHLSWFFENFDSNGSYSMLGFGAKPHGERYVSHCFPIGTSEARGPEGVVRAYNENKEKYTFAEPCYLSEIMRTLIRPYEGRTSFQTQPLTYQILVVLTQGDFDDFEQFKEQLVRASKLPISVILVGLGNNGFPQLVLTDSDKKLMMTSTGEVEERDLVQRVIYNDFRVDDRGFVHEAFAELPRQLREFMMANKLG